MGEIDKGALGRRKGFIYRYPTVSFLLLALGFYFLYCLYENSWEMFLKGSFKSTIFLVLGIVLAVLGVWGVYRAFHTSIGLYENGMTIKYAGAKGIQVLQKVLPKESSANYMGSMYNALADAIPDCILYSQITKITWYVPPDAHRADSMKTDIVIHIYYREGEHARCVDFNTKDYSNMEKKIKRIAQKHRIPWVERPY